MYFIAQKHRVDLLTTYASHFCLSLKNFGLDKICIYDNVILSQTILHLLSQVESVDATFLCNLLKRLQWYSDRQTICCSIVSLPPDLSWLFMCRSEGLYGSIIQDDIDICFITRRVHNTVLTSSFVCVFFYRYILDILVAPYVECQKYDWQKMLLTALNRIDH